MIKVSIKVREGLNVRIKNVINCLKDIETPEEIICEVEKAYQSLQDDLLDARNKLVRKDYDLENANNKLVSLAEQNRHMRALLMEEWQR